MNIIQDRFLKIQANYVNFTSSYSNFSETDIPHFRYKFNYQTIYVKLFALYIQRKTKLLFEKKLVNWKEKKSLIKTFKIKIEIVLDKSYQYNKIVKKNQLFILLLLIYPLWQIIGANILLLIDAKISRFSPLLPPFNSCSNCFVFYKNGSRCRNIIKKSL